MRMGMPHHILGVPKAIRDKIGKKPGDVVKIVLWKDDEPREVAVPPELQARMKSAGVLPFFESLSFTHRRGILPLDHRGQEGRDAGTAAR